MRMRAITSTLPLMARAVNPHIFSGFAIITSDRSIVVCPDLSRCL